MNEAEQSLGFASDADLEALGLTRQQYRRNVAIHEAGHAVAHYRLFSDGYLDQVSIALGEGYDGACSAPEHYVYEHTPDEEAEQYFLDYAIMCCAGYAALSASGAPENQASFGCEDDFETAGHRFERAKAKAVSLMEEPRNVAAVARLAEALEQRETIGREHIQVLIDLSDGEISEAEYQEYLAFQIDICDEAAEVKGDG